MAWSPFSFATVATHAGASPLIFIASACSDSQPSTFVCAAQLNDVRRLLLRDERAQRIGVADVELTIRDDDVVAAPCDGGAEVGAEHSVTAENPNFHER